MKMRAETKAAINLYIALSKKGYVHDAIVRLAMDLIITVAVMSEGELVRSVLDEVEEVFRETPEPPEDAAKALREHITHKTGGGCILNIPVQFVKDGIADMCVVRRTLEETEGNA